MLPFARQGCRAYFSLASVYSALGLAKASHASQWVHKRLGGFMSGMLKAGLQGHLSRPWGDSHKQRRKKEPCAASADECALLSAPSASSCGLFYLLMQWGHRSKFQGGFGGESDQRAAKEMLSSLVRVVAPELQRLSLALAGHEHWTPPRPLCGSDRVSITIGAGGGFEFPELPPDLSADQVSFLEDKLHWVAGKVSSVSDLVQLVCEACFRKGWAFLPAQLSIRLGCALDRMMAALGDWSLVGDLPGAISWVGESQRSESQLDYRDLRYWNLGRQAAMDHMGQPWCIVTDGTRAGGREMLNGAVIPPSNVAVQFTPLALAGAPSQLAAPGRHKFPLDMRSSTRNYSQALGGSDPLGNPR